MADSDSTPYGIIYCIEHIETGRVYIGQTTTSLSNRWSSHKKNTCCVLLHRAITKYGEDAFSKRILDTAVSKEELNEKEIIHIAKFQSASRTHGFNLREGGSFGKHSAESKLKMSIAVRKAFQDPVKVARVTAGKLGVKRSPQARENIAAGHRGLKATDDARANISKAASKMWADHEYRGKVAESQKTARSDPAYIGVVSENSKSQWADPVKREALIASRNATLSDPIKLAAKTAKWRASMAANKAAKLALQSSASI